MTKIQGGNCDIIIDTELHTAKKVLRNTSKKEKIDRFRSEMEILKRIKDDDKLQIAKILEIKEDPNIKNCYILMKYYEFTLGDLLPKTKSSVEFTLRLLLPIIETLYRLSLLDKPIYHRDLKPDNILSDGENAFLSDFGIAIIEGDDRITSTLEAIGARLFLAPEYEVGKVDIISEKGDIYSIGKIIWYLINGVKEELLPYNLWFEQKYNLLNKVPEIKNAYFANYLIMNCLEIDPNRRPSYASLIKDIKSFLEEPVSFESKKDELVLLEKLKKNELESIKTYNHYFSFLTIVSNEFEMCLKKLKETFDNDYINSMCEKLSFKKNINSAAKRGPSGSISVFSMHNKLIRINFLGYVPNEYVVFEFVDTSSTQIIIKKIVVRQTNMELTIDYKPFTFDIFYSAFIEGVTKLLK